MVFDRATTAGAALTTLLLVCQTSLSESLVCGPHGAFLVVAADSKLLAERILVVIVGASVRCDVAVFEILLGSEVGGLYGSFVSCWNALVGGGRVSVEGRVRRERSVVCECSIVVGGSLPRDGGSEGWRVDAGSWEHGGLLVGLGDDRGAECGFLGGSHGECECDLEDVVGVF